MSNFYRKVSEKSRPATSTAAKRGLPSRISKVASKAHEEVYDQDGNFNPKSNNSKKRAFNDKGTLNAYDKKDALVQINNIRNKRQASYEEAANTFTKTTKEERREVLAAAMNDPSGMGRRLVAQQLAEPIKAILDYEGFSRKLFQVKTLGQAEQFRIPTDVRSVAYIIGGDGGTPEARISSSWIFPPEVKITSFPTIDLLDTLQLNFDALERAQDTARQEIALKEDKYGLDLIDTASTAINDVTTFASLGITAFEAVRFQVERHRLLVENFLINRAEVSDIVTTMSSAVDPVTERELIMAGYIGQIMNAFILTSAGIGSQEVIPAGTIYAITGKDYLGVMGVRHELTAQPFDKLAQGETVTGFGFVEVVGFGLPNARSVAKGSK